MAISATTGAAANDSSGSATSKALPSFNTTIGQDIVVAVALGSTSSSVTSITDTKGNTYTLKKAQNGTGVRTELWQSRNVGAQTSNIITVHFSPATTVAIAAEEYAGTANGSFSPLSRSGWSIPFVDSTFSGSFLGPNVLDGTPSTLWSSANTAFPHEIQLDMGSPQTFSLIEYQSRSDAADFGLWLTFDVYVSTDGVTWGSPIASPTGTDIGAAGAFEVFDLGSSYTKRYLRFVIHTATGNNTASCGELFVGSPASAPSQNTDGVADSGTYLHGGVVTEESGNFAVGAMGFVCASGDTLTAVLGTSRQSSIPAATAVGVALYDNSMLVDGTPEVMTRISTSRQWAVATLELRSLGASAITAADYAAVSAAALQVPRDVRYLNVKSVQMLAGFIGLLDIESRNVRDGVNGIAYTETLVGIGGFTPYTFALTSGSLPTGLTLHTSTGIIDGTPTVVGSSTFTVTVTDSHSVTASRSFTIVVSAAASGGSYAFIG
jgi:hypothetical protein